MGFFEFPHTRTYDSDLGWLIKNYHSLSEKYSSLVADLAAHIEDYDELKALYMALSAELNQIIDYINDVVEPWDGTVAYKRYTLVEYLGDTYIALKDVPAGVLITDTNYWDLANNITAEIAVMKADILEILSTHCKTYQTMADMIADFSADDIICRVINGVISLRAGITSPCGVTYYVYSSTAAAFEETLVHGGYAVLKVKPCTVEPMDLKNLPAMLATGYSYCGVNKPGGFTTPDGIVPNVTYRPMSGPYATIPAGWQGIQCSQFVNAVLRGLTYEQSKLENPLNENFSASGACRDLIWEGVDHDLAASELAHFAAATGRYKEISKIQDLEIGDVAFFADETATNIWRGIGHCALVVGKTNSSVMLMGAGGAQSVTGFGRQVFRPGYADDAVNFTIYTGFGDLVSTNFSLVGAARFTVNFPELPTLDTVAITTPVTAGYSAGASNVFAYIYRYTDAKSGRFMLLDWSGYTEKRDSGAGFLLSCQTQNSVYNAGGTLFSTVDVATMGGTMPALFAVDADSLYIQLAYTFRLTGTSQADEYSMTSLIGKLFR